MAFDQTSFTVDLIGRFVCNTWHEAINMGGPARAYASSTSFADSTSAR